MLLMHMLLLLEEVSVPSSQLRSQASSKCDGAPFRQALVFFFFDSACCRCVVVIRAVTDHCPLGINKPTILVSKTLPCLSHNAPHPGHCCNTGPFVCSAAFFVPNVL